MAFPGGGDDDEKKMKSFSSILDLVKISLHG